jgi:hypothetical protein
LAFLRARKTAASVTPMEESFFKFDVLGSTVYVDTDNPIKAKKVALHVVQPHLVDTGQAGTYRSRP